VKTGDQKDGQASWDCQTSANSLSN
jgi:hypothetical protein